MGVALRALRAPAVRLSAAGMNATQRSAQDRCSL
jgi:hypothetical protein